MVVERLPEATELDIAFRAGGGLSPGTARTALEGLGSGGRARIGGRIATVPSGWRRRTADFPSGRVTVTSIPWGDVSTAFHSTGVPDVVTFLQLPGGGTPRLQRLAAPAARIPGVRRVLGAAIHRRVTGPDAARRGRSRSEVWVQARSADGRSVSGSLTAPNVYALTADSVVRVVDRVLAGSVPPGAHTPSKAHGSGFVLELDEVTLHGVEDRPG
jgi:saccharopine dehydrogenase (NAD+, L-lysine-forming)